MDMLDGKVRGFFLLGENPAVGSPNARLHRLAMAKLDWLVVRDLVEIESASFWHDAPEIESGELRTEDIATEVFLLPAASHVEKEGSFTNTQRLLQWREKALDPKGDCRSELWFMYHLGRIVRERLAGSTDPKDRPVLDLTWDYPTEGPHDDPDAEAVLREINGWGPDGRALSAFTELKADGSTACGCWIYCGCYAGEVEPGRPAHAARPSRAGSRPSGAGPGRPTGASSTTGPRPTPTAGPGRSASAMSGGTSRPGQLDRRTTCPTSPRPSRPATSPPRAPRPRTPTGGDEPFIMQADGRGALFVPSGLEDGPLPAHYEPQESPFANPLYGQQQNPTRQEYTAGPATATTRLPATRWPRPTRTCSPPTG